MLNKAFYIILFLSLSCCVQAQKIMRNTSLLNYQRGDRTVLHFGFSLGINYMDYKAVLSGANGWRAESGKLDVGFLVGIVSELRLGDDWGLRFLPGLEFATRSLVYTQVPAPVLTEAGLPVFGKTYYITLRMHMPAEKSQTER